MKKQLIVGNWKMNKTHAEATMLTLDLSVRLASPKREVVVCPPFTSLYSVMGGLNDSCIKLGAQNVSWAEEGAFTGEVSAAMLSALGVEYVIVGHSERRAMFAETDKTVAMRAAAALKQGITPIICVGETQAEREGGLTNKVLAVQLTGSLAGFSAEEINRVVVAYEPVWAIGTGLTATDAQAEEACAFIRAELKKTGAAADIIRILYGGSMNAGNAAGLLSMPNINGGLIGGASLKADDFVRIVNS